MNKTELTRELAQRAGITQLAAADVVDHIFNPDFGIIADELHDGGKVTIGGFGIYETRQRAARTGRNPRTGEAIEIPAKRFPAFRAARNLKDRLE